MAIPRQNTTTDKYKFPLGSPVSNNAMKPPTQPAWQFGLKQKIQTHRIKATSLTLNKITQLSAAANASGTIGNGTTLFLNTKLTPNAPIAQFPNFAVPYIALYQDTAVGSNQIYPAVGAGVTPGAYTVQGGLDYQSYNGTNSSWSGIITDNSAGGHNILFYTQWKFIALNPGTQT